jgi:uncharacterized protein (DUF2147 family)
MEIDPVIMLSMVLAAANPASDVFGRWLTQDRSGMVTIAPCATGICGTLTRILARGPDVPTTDINNPKPRLRGRSLVGAQILSGLKRQSTGWSGGTVYDPKTGRSYKASLTLDPGGALTVTGCLFIICKSQRWTRVGG